MTPEFRNLGEWKRRVWQPLSPPRAEVETRVVFTPRDLPAAVDIPSSILSGIESSFVRRDLGYYLAPFVDIPTATVSSPTFSISTEPDSTPTELSGEGTITHYDTFYFGDGNIKIVCGNIIFRVHPTILSFSSSKLRDMIFPSTLRNAPSPHKVGGLGSCGCSRRGRFWITKTPSQCGFEPVLGAENGVRVTVCRLSSWLGWSFSFRPCQ